MDNCQRPGCSGKIVDGVCEDCGRAPVGKSLVAAAAAAGSVRSAVSAGPASTRSTASAVSAVSSSSSSPFSGRTGSGRTGSGRSGRTGSRGSRGSTRRALGAGLVTLPPTPSLDPLQSLLADPVVPERKRFCANCGAKVNNEKGFCPQCGQEYSFIPTLKPGNVVAGQYEVKGAIAFGGLGWIYLGWDNVLSRWVVLKGLLNSKDAVSAQAAVTERQFLAAVKHPKLVGVYNFVTLGADGYIVMEYVGGKTLKALRQERGPLPPPEAIAYIYAILPAFAYLERQGLVYCDFKPDNCMLEDDDVKLIDMGGVRRIDDLGGDVYGTKGYSAPEADDAPSFVSDLYTVARTLAVLLMDFPLQGANLYTLPPRESQTILTKYESLDRWLRKATREHPNDRFQTADEMGDQLLGVLREIVAEEGTPRPAESILFGGDALLDVGADAITAPSEHLLPLLKVDPLDPAANAVLALGGADPARLANALHNTASKFPDSSEAPLRLALAQMTEGHTDKAELTLKDVEEKDAFDWRVHWYRGRCRLIQGKASEAYAAFDRVYGELPGELAPKLACALAAEMAGDGNTAARLYDVISRTDPSYASAAFGLARCRAALGDRAGAVAAYGRVPAASSLYVPAQLALARVLISATPAPPNAAELIQASQAIQALALDGIALHRFSADLFLTAVAQMEARVFPASDTDRVLGQAMQLKALREGAERELRACAHLAETPKERTVFVDQANQVRPRTLF